MSQRDLFRFYEFVNEDPSLNKKFNMIIKVLDKECVYLDDIAYVKNNIVRLGREYGFNFTEDELMNSIMIVEEPNDLSYSPLPREELYNVAGGTINRKTAGLTLAGLTFAGLGGTAVTLISNKNQPEKRPAKVSNRPQASDKQKTPQDDKKKSSENKSTKNGKAPQNPANSNNHDGKSGNKGEQKLNPNHPLKRSGKPNSKMQSPYLNRGSQPNNQLINNAVKNENTSMQPSQKNRQQPTAQLANVSGFKIGTRYGYSSPVAFSKPAPAPLTDRTNVPRIENLTLRSHNATQPVNNATSFAPSFNRPIDTMPVEPTNITSEPTKPINDPTDTTNSTPTDTPIKPSKKQKDSKISTKTKSKKTPKPASTEPENTSQTNTQLAEMQQELSRLQNELASKNQTINSSNNTTTVTVEPIITDAQVSEMQKQNADLLSKLKQSQATQTEKDGVMNVLEQAINESSKKLQLLNKELQKTRDDNTTLRKNLEQANKTSESTAKKLVKIADALQDPDKDRQYLLRILNGD